MAEKERKGVSTLDEFAQAVNLLAALYKKDGVRFRVWLPANVDLLIDESTIKELIEGKEMELDRLQEILDREVSIAISALISDNKELFIEGFYPRYYPGVEEEEEEEEKPREEIEEEGRRKIELCEERFDFLPTVEAQYRTKRKSRLDIFKRVAWDTSTKEFSKGDKTKEVIFATLQFIFQKQPIEARSAYRFYPYLPILPPQEESVAFDCHLNDVLGLIEVLTKVANALSEKEAK